VGIFGREQHKPYHYYEVTTATIAREASWSSDSMDRWLNALPAPLKPRVEGRTKGSCTHTCARLTIIAKWRDPRTEQDGVLITGNRRTVALRVQGTIRSLSVLPTLTRLNPCCRVVNPPFIQRFRNLSLPTSLSGVFKLSSLRLIKARFPILVHGSAAGTGQCRDSCLGTVSPSTKEAVEAV